MSKNPPNISGSRYSVIRPKDSCKYSPVSKLKFNSLVINSVFKFADNETEYRQKPSRKSCDSLMNTLINVEREHVRGILNIKKPTNNPKNFDSHNTPERKSGRKIKKKKLSIDINMHYRKINSGGKYDNNDKSPFSEKVSKILF